MSDPVLMLSDTPEPDAVRIISDGLNAYNDAIVGYADRRPLHVILRDGAGGPVLGGISGATSLGVLFVNTVFLPAGHRGAGLGARMLAMAEAEARRRGCRTGVLFTISFQAPGFYQRCGWRIFGEIPSDPPGTTRVFLTKDLGVDEAAR